MTEGIKLFVYPVQTLRDAGAQPDQDVKDVGGGRLIASVKDSDGNIIALVQSP